MTHHDAHNNPSSPCIGVCELDSDGCCAGCDRTRQEIAVWGSLSEAQRRHIMDIVLPRRRKDRT